MELKDDLDLGILFESKRFRKNEILLRCQDLFKDTNGSQLEVSNLDIEKEAQLMLLLFKDITNRGGQAVILSNELRLKSLIASDDFVVESAIEKLNSAEFAVGAVGSSVPETVNAIRKQINKNKKKQKDENTNIVE